MCSKNTIILLTNAKNNGSIFPYLAEMPTYLQKTLKRRVVIGCSHREFPTVKRKQKGKS